MGLRSSQPHKATKRCRPPLKTTALAGLQLLGRFRGTDFAGRFTTLLARWRRIMQSGSLHFRFACGREIAR